MIKKRYKNIIEFVKENNLYNDMCNEVGPGRTLEEYLDDYCDRNIVELVMCDMYNITDEEFEYKVYPKWGEGYLNWQETEVEIF